jgi:MHS family proline/betaine transporter-like MFS transporter
MARINNVGVAAELVGVTLLIILLAVHITRGPGVAFETNGTGAGHDWGYFGAFLLGSIVILAVSSSLSRAQLDTGGWRLPFLVGLLIVPVGLRIRSTMQESPLFTRARATGAPSVSLPRRALAVAAGIVVLYVAAPYVLLLYMPTYAVRELHLALPQALMASVVAGIVGLIACPLVGAWSDRVGRRPLMLAAALGLAALAYPAFALLTSAPQFATLAAVQAAFALLTVLYAAPANAVLAECFPTRRRSVSMAVVYNAAAAAVGGSAQFIVIWLTAATGNPRAPAFFVAGAAAISAAAVCVLRDRFRDPLS